MKPRRPLQLFAIVGPGLLVAATGVGAGDLATAAFTGSRVGIVVLWAVVLGAFMKFVLNEGLARWQLATGDTLLEGAVRSFGPAVAVVFLPYLLVWSVLVALALMSASGVTMHAILPVFDDARHAKIVFGIGHGLVGVVLVLLGGFRLFEKVMGVCIAVMFLTVLVTTVCIWPGTSAVLGGFVPTVSVLSGDGLQWTIALTGGVGGTVTILCYGYWIREEGRTSRDALATCRIDLGVAYTLTAIFGLCMVIIGSSFELPTKGGAGLVVELGAQLESRLGRVGRWAFLAGAWCAVFSSLLGVWQAVPYLFTDLWALLRARRRSGKAAAVDPAGYASSRPYRVFLVALAVVPMVLLGTPFSTVQKAYAISGALFLPMLAAALLVLNGRTTGVGEVSRNRPATTVTLALIVGFFVWLLVRAVAA